MKHLLLVLAMLTFTANVFSQETETETETETKIEVETETETESKTKSEDSTSTAVSEKKWRFSSGFGLNFVGSTNISVSPNVIYTVSDKVSFGGGLQGSYISIKDYRKTTTIGVNVIGYYRPAKKIMLLLEFVELNVSHKTETPTEEIKNNFWDSALFTGAGFNITKKIAVGAKYNLLYKEEESVYTSAIVPFVNISF